MSRNKRKNIVYTNQIFKFIIIVLLLFALRYINDYVIGTSTEKNTANANSTYSNINLNSIPEYTDKAYIDLNNNKPYFSEEEHTTKVFETYSPLDSKGRCGVAYANICKELMPKKRRKT